MAMTIAAMMMRSVHGTAHSRVLEDAAATETTFEESTMTWDRAVTVACSRNWGHT